MSKDPALPQGDARQTPQGKLPVLALSALGIVFGDIGTSPLYTFKTVLGTAEVPSDVATILGTLSLVLACDSEGGVCSGNAQATITVRVEIIARRDGRQIASRRILFKEKLANVTFAIAPGASISLS